jgi:hypothetical protein
MALRFVPSVSGNAPALTELRKSNAVYCSLLLTRTPEPRTLASSSNAAPGHWPASLQRPVRAPYSVTRRSRTQGIENSAPITPKPNFSHLQARHYPEPEMKFTEFFELIRQHKEAAGEAKRIGDLEDVVWDTVPTRWLLLAVEHFAVMIYVWNAQNIEDRPDFWIEMRQRTHTALLSRLMPKGGA